MTYDKSSKDDAALSATRDMYSDAYKYAYGTRPNLSSLDGMSVDEIQIEIDRLYNEENPEEGWTRPWEMMSGRARQPNVDVDAGVADPLGDIEHEEYYDPQQDLPKHGSMRRYREGVLRSFIRAMLTETTRADLRADYLAADKMYTLARDRYARAPHDDASARKLADLRARRDDALAKLQSHSDALASVDAKHDVVPAPARKSDGGKHVYGDPQAYGGSSRRGLGS